MTDPIADMLTRIRNALTAKHETVTVPASKVKAAIADILVREGYIKAYEIVEKPVQNDILITLKYSPVKGQKVVTGLKRVSSPGLRIYAGTDNLPKVLNGMGIAILSTSKGILTDKEAREQRIGGEVLAYVW
ncbi:MAG TPA: 30S ribosomal protein S8 [Candidatus Limadaptatus stercoripullorum]|uniref:Small ribosomal subunit protein uS8 n=1 Tax=Candidatus Limadaptatus stercoripullorum TaxID=2840846 RepID=A0A9D1N970_9FIRM|nr:30S ribosomal protein S8 [Candidatus Limadaptatus stercoripullorum]